MEQTIALLLQYKYAILFPLSIVEGPILAVIGGFLASLSILNALVVYIIVLTGDIIGDAILYLIGRYGGEKFVNRFGKLFRITEQKIISAKNFFTTHRKKSLVMSKVFHGIGISGLITAGSLKIPYSKYFFTCFYVSLIQSAVLVIIGFLFGGAYVQIGRYFDYFAATMTIVALIIIAILIIKARNKIIKK